MKKILIIAQGDVANRFIQRIAEVYSADNIYYVVEAKLNDYEHLNKARFKFFEFDSTSEYKLANLLKMDFFEVFIILENRSDIEHTIKNIRNYKKTLRVILLSEFDFEFEDQNIIKIAPSQLLASRLIDYLPNIPVIAQNIGLGEGEIMEVSVPFGSSFIYRHIESLEQKEWKIVAIYRNSKLIMPDRRKMIYPNDTLLLVGEPKMLKSVYLAIKKELGQFPQPFGSNLYLYVDMMLLDLKNAHKFINRAIFIKNQLNKPLYIRVVNPSDFETIWHIKRYRDLDVMIEIDYSFKDSFETLKNDIKKYHIGLVMVSKDMFRDDTLRARLYEVKIPVLKLSNKIISELKDSVVILGDNRDLEKISSTIFDISQQMGHNLELYNYLSEHQEIKEQLIEHFTNLSNIFSKTIKVKNETQNPIRVLKKRDNFLQLIPFTRHITRKRKYSLLSTKSDKLYFKLDDFHQIFIPI